MSIEYTMEQVRRMTQEELSTKLNIVYAKQSAWRDNARRALDVRNGQAAGGNRFDSFLRNYNAKYIRPGRYVRFSTQGVCAHVHCIL